VAVDSSVPLDNGVIYDNYNGTSMAAPHVTGAWALVKQNNPTASVSDVLNILQNTGVIVTDTNGIGIPRIQLDAATQTGDLVGTVTAAGTGNPIPNATVSTTGAGSYTTTTDANGDYILPVPVGNYNVTAAAYGYQPLTANNVAVSLNGTSTQDFALTAVASYLVSGVVTDAATGWPLYARIDIPEYPGSPVWTDPVTGAYSVTLAGGIAYQFTVSAWVEGYTNATRTVGPLSGSSTQNFALAANALVCTAPGYTSTSSPIFNSSFETAFAADGWAQVDTNGTSGNWTRPTAGTNPTASPHTGNRLAMFNSFSATSGHQTRLYRTSGLNLSSYTSPEASFWLFNGSCGWTGNDTVQLQISTNGGSSWNNVGAPVPRLSAGGWQQHSFDISPYAGAGMTDVRLALLGSSGFGCNIHVDDVTVVENSCTPTSGELVLGNVYDANTTAGINSATVSNQDGYNTTSAATPADPNVDDGFYTLFSPVGSKTFTASARYYADDVDIVAVVANDVTRHNFFLDAGQLSYAPTAVSVSIPAGTSTNQSLTLTNDGSVAANFTLLELGTAVNMTLDDGSMDNSIGLSGSQFVWFNRFTPAPTAYPFKLRQVSVIFQDSVAVGDTVELVVWADADGNPNNGATLQYTENVQVIHNDGTSWNDYTLAAPVLLNGPGDVLIGLVNRSSVSGVADFPAAIDQTTSQGRSWLGSYGGNVPEPPTLPAPNNWGVVDTLGTGLAGNWMIRGIGYQDVPWLSESPTSGVVPGLNNQIINLTLDASALSPGQYTTQLATHHDTPYPVANVPITLTVFTGYLWNGSVNSNWDNPLNWTPNGAPGTLDSVIVDPTNLTGASVWPILNVNPTVTDLTVEADAELTIPNGRSLTVTGSLINNGLLRQTINNVNSPTTFLGMGGYGGVEINPSGSMGNTTVEIRGNQDCTTNPTSQPVQRCFNISPATSQTATIRFYYLPGEANGNPENGVNVYHWNGGSWDLQTGTTTHSSGGDPRWVQVTGVSNFSPFVLDNGLPTAVSLTQFTTGSSGTGTAVLLI
ncbi:MAG: carboxypeptidase regulatory-like domain-containing protein, partial [Anaerolineae bacterium]|nr:carboxypeptidase regulatory-like domain-containing protein [Anaerolineae bacterium]